MSHLLSIFNCSSYFCSIPKGLLFSLPVPAVPWPEQKKIAAILAAVDGKIQNIAAQITAIQALKQSLMQMFFKRGVGTKNTYGDWLQHVTFKKTECGKIPATWVATHLGQLAQEARQRNSGSIAEELLCGVFKDQGLIPMRDRVKGASTDRCRIVVPDAFAYNPMRINIGSIARNRLNHAVMVSPDYVVFATKPDVLLPTYLDHFRNSTQWTRFVGQAGDGGVRIRIYFDHLARMVIPLPPVAEQKRIVEILDEVDAKLAILKKKHALYQTLKRGLMQKLLSGESRVKCDDATAAQ